MISNPNYEVHKDEVELLKNILFDQLVMIDEMPHYIMEIIVKPDVEVEGETKLNVRVKIKLPDDYPNTIPLCDVNDLSNLLASSKIKGILEKIKTFCEESLGFPMVYQIYEMVKDFANEQEEIINKENISKSTQEEESKRKYQEKLDLLDKGLIETKTFTPVTKEAFEVWFKKYYANEIKHIRKNPEQELRMTGREYFMNLKNLKAGDEQLDVNEDDVKEEEVDPNAKDMYFDADAFNENLEDIDFDNLDDIDDNDIDDI